MHICGLVGSNMSGLCANMARCGVVGISMSGSTLNNLAEVIGRVSLAWPITCLGFPWGGNPRYKFWDEVVSMVY